MHPIYEKFVVTIETKIKMHPDWTQNTLNHVIMKLFNQFISYRFSAAASRLSVAIMDSF